MQTIALVTQKGGSGKSTLAIGLAISALQAGHKVCLLETDPQDTVSNWRARWPSRSSKPSAAALRSSRNCRFSTGAA